MDPVTVGAFAISPIKSLCVGILFPILGAWFDWNPGGPVKSSEKRKDVRPPLVLRNSKSFKHDKCILDACDLCHVTSYRMAKERKV